MIPILRPSLVLLILLLALAPPGDARAFVPLEEWLIATEACSASRSIRGEADSVLEVGRAYPLRGQNKAEASHFHVRLAEDGNLDRWVAVACGIHVVRAETAARPDPDPEPDPDPGPDPDPSLGAAPDAMALLLAVSWQPAFCEGRPQKTECRSQTETRFDATHFALHGLWPQPRGNDYCGVSSEDERADKDRRWADLPALDLTAATREDLDRIMPGTQSLLHRHEWIKHGTCYSDAAERYYRDSLALMNQLNASAVRTLFADNIASTITAAQVRERFDAAFGAGAGARVKLVCKQDGGRRLITELQVHLQGRVTEIGGLGTLLAAGADVSAGCSSGVVDPVGLQ